MGSWEHLWAQTRLPVRVCDPGHERRNNTAHVATMNTKDIQCPDCRGYGGKECKDPGCCGTRTVCASCEEKPENCECDMLIETGNTPLGIMPRWVWDEKRVRHIIETIALRKDAYAVEGPWAEELHELLGRLLARKKP